MAALPCEQPILKRQKIGHSVAVVLEHFCRLEKTLGHFDRRTRQGSGTQSDPDSQVQIFQLRNLHPILSRLEHQAQHCASVKAARPPPNAYFCSHRSFRFHVLLNLLFSKLLLKILNHSIRFSVSVSDHCCSCTFGRLVFLCRYFSVRRSAEARELGNGRGWKGARLRIPRICREPP